MYILLFDRVPLLRPMALAIAIGHHLNHIV